MKLKPISCPNCGAISGHEKIEENERAFSAFTPIYKPIIVTTWSCGGCGRKFETRAFPKLKPVEKA